MRNYTDFVISFSQINQLIADLYDTGLPLPQRINRLFTELKKVILFDRANILFYRKRNSRYEMHSIFTYNWTLAEEVEYQVKYCYQDDVLALLDYDHSISFITDQTFNSSVREKSEYFRDFLLPMGQHSSIETNFSVRQQHLRGIFSVHRGKDKQPFTDEDLRIIKMFQPHLPNIFQDYGKPEETEEDLIPDILHNSRNIGVCAFDQDIHFIGCNDTFRRFADYGVDLMDSLISKRLKVLCLRLKNTGQSSIEYKVKDMPYFLEVRSQTIFQSSQRTRYICICYDTGWILERCTAQLCRENDLTSREEEVLHLAVCGNSNEQIAEALHISISTVKKHLVSVYDKMGVKNLKQILQLLHFYGRKPTPA